MVLLAAGIVSKQNGKILISRQFVEMTRSRIEGLLTSFSKLITKDKQHTFIETDSVRYVYQALMDRLYCVLITTKTSNILEDLETLRLFVRVINEYTSTPSKSSISDEQAVLDNAFTLIFAFDEIVALGYRESVNLSQVRTFIEMDSHEERVYVAVRQSQEREAKQKMRERAKELAKLQRTQALAKMTSQHMQQSTYPSASVINEIKGETYAERNSSSSYQPPSRPREGRSKALKLGAKKESAFLPPEAEEQLVTELASEEVRPGQPAGAQEKKKAVQQEPVDVTVEEKFKCEINREGGTLNLCELAGTLMIHIRDDAFLNAKIQIECEDDNIQFQTHPNVDKELFKKSQTIGLRNKSFPLNTSVGVVKYRRFITTTSDDWPPLSITAWPNGNNCNVEVAALRPLSDVRISIPCPSQPIVNECREGEYEWKKTGGGILMWSFSFLSPDSSSVVLDFDIDQTIDNDSFFPVKATFVPETNLAGISVIKVSQKEDGEDDGRWSLGSKLTIEKYEVV